MFLVRTALPSTLNSAAGDIGGRVGRVAVQVAGSGRAHAP